MHIVITVEADDAEPSQRPTRTVGRCHLCNRSEDKKDHMCEL